MALKFANNNSLSAITTKPSGLSGGALNLISTQTASSSSTISFTSGIDSTYDEYVFKFIDIHRSAETFLTFNMSTDGGSNYNVAKTSAFFNAYHNESGADSTLQYTSSWDLAQGTGFQRIANGGSASADESTSGFLHLFNPSSATFVKHFMGRTVSNETPYCEDYHLAGYGNTTSAVDSIQFKMESGNIDSGVIKLYGVS